MPTQQLLKKPAFLAIGSELLDGRVQDTNALFAVRNLKDFGVTLSAISICDDIEEEIIEALDLLAKNSSFIIISGGLGPTTDDLTREAIAHFCGVKLYQDNNALIQIQEIFKRRKRVFNQTNNKQATFPIGATIINNPIGTAPGFSIKATRNNKELTIVALPGVPKEFQLMYKETVEPLILKELEIASKQPLKLIRVFGLPESEIGGRVENLKLADSLSISYRAHFPEIQVKISHTSDAKLVEDSMMQVVNALGADHIFSEFLEEKFEQVVLNRLQENNTTIAVAESCTGGMISAFLTNPAGASRVFLGGVVSYANSAKQDLLHVTSSDLASFGAVSAEVAKSMAEGVRTQFGSDIGLSITGIAGPDGGSDEKPVGTYFIGLASAKASTTFKLFFLSSRENFRRYVSYVALDILRRYASQLNLTPYIK